MHFPRNAVPWICFLLLGSGLGVCRGAEPVVERAATALYDGIETAALPNGLRVYLKPVPGCGTITTLVAYKVGSADEDKTHTGLSHYLEHLMFKGTDKLMPGDIDRLTLRNGGANNAFTTEDYTIFHFDFPAEQWQVPLRIEADRMRNLRIDAKHEFEQEKGAVISELEQNEDQPWDLELKAILPLLFGPKAPYGHPVIGERQHVRDATAPVIQGHYNKWYHPNNAALVVVGDFDPAPVLAKIKELFGPIPRKELPPRKEYVPLVRKGPVIRERPSKFEVPRLLAGFNTVKIGEPDYYSLEVIQGILSGGKTSRLYRALVEGAQIANAADTGNNAGRYPGWFTIQVELLKDKSLPEADKLLLAELKKLRDQPVSETELKRVKQQIIAGLIFGRESVHQLGDIIARGVTTNDLDFLKNYLNRIAAVTPEDVQKAAKKYLDADKRVEIRSMPHVEKKGGSGKGTSEKRRRRALAAKDAAADGISLQNAKRVVLPNGLTLLLYENHRLPIVVAEAFVRNLRLMEPADKAGVGVLVSRLLDEGTSKQSGQEIAEMIESVGGSLGFSPTGGAVKVLTPNRSLGLRLLFQCLSDPAFPPEAFERQKQQQLSEIADAEQRPDAKAADTFRALAYGKHPFGKPLLGTRKTVEKLTAADCRAFYRQMFVPNNLIVAIVGDFETKQVVDELTKLSAKWKKGAEINPYVPGPGPPEKFVEKIVTMPAAAQLHFYLGHPGIQRYNRDYYKLLVLDNVLGTGPGFTDRLSARLRDREGLAYTVSASITSSATEQPGLFTCYIGTQPANFAKVKQMFLEELNRIRDTKPTKAEVEDAKQYLLGSLPFQFTTDQRIADQLLAVERFGLGFNYLNDYKKAVAAVTPEDVQAVAKKYLDPKHMILVVAGAVGPDGKPLAKLPPPKGK